MLSQLVPRCRSGKMTSAARAEEPASSSSNTVAATITRTIHELRGTVIPFGTHVGRTVGWVMDDAPRVLDLGLSASS